ncbi:MAG: hypothetical protein ACRC80_10140 [Waterburya sp.]
MLSFTHKTLTPKKYKQAWVDLLIKDKEQEKLVKGRYYSKDDQKGCAVGCSEYALCKLNNIQFENRKHEAMAEMLSIPVELCHLEDKIFENLPNETANQWVIDFSSALPVGKDMTNICRQFNIEILTNKDFGVYQFANKETQAIIDEIVDAIRREITGDIVNKKLWDQLATKAWSAKSTASTATAYATASTAAYVASAYAATSTAAYVVATSTASTYAYTAAAYTDSLAKSTTWVKMSERLIKLLQEA